MSTATVQEYISPSPLKVSTYTMVCNIINKSLSHKFRKIDLYVLSRILPIYTKSDTTGDSKSGCSIMIGKYTESGTTDLPRGNLPDMLSGNEFNNQITLQYKYYGFRNINIKIFSNGKLQMTGIIDPEWETKHIADVITSNLVNLKYRVYTNPAHLAKITNYDYAIAWNPDTASFDWYRRNVTLFDVQNIKTRGLKYDYKASDWTCSKKSRELYTSYINYAVNELRELDTVRDTLLNKYEFTGDEIMSYIALANQYKKIIKLDKKLETSKNFKTDITDAINKIIKYFTNYSHIFQKLEYTDTLFFNKVMDQYTTQATNDITTCPLGKLPEYYEYDTFMSNAEYYKLSNVAIELINSDYNTRFNNKLASIHQLLTKKYNLYAYYKPNNKYAGIIVKFFTNPAYSDTAKYAPGRCHCTDSCITSKNAKSCVKLTISIFRPGSIIITAAKDIRQLVFAYNFINTLLKDNFSHVTYDDASGVRRDHYKANEDRKIIRKEIKYYVPKTAIVYPASAAAASTLPLSS